MAAGSGPALERDPAADEEAPVESPAEHFASVPTYLTRPPPSATLLFDVRRGELSGRARLQWRAGEGGDYEIELRSEPAARAEGTERPNRTALALALSPHWTSRGRIDSAGMAPERFAVLRRERERHAANFRRDVGIVGFAGPARTWPLVPGAQDRLSWMLQLAAVLEAGPALAAEGTQIKMVVFGAHGDAALWTFAVGGREVVPAPAGPEGTPHGSTVEALRLHRFSQQAHDPQVEVWLAPSLHHLPVRLRVTAPRTGQSTEFVLRALQAP